MSFSNSYAGYQNVPGGDAYNRLSNTTSVNVQKISQNVNSMQRMVNQLGTPSDSENLRDQLQQIQHYTNQLARETNNCIKELSSIPQPQSISEQRQRRMLKERLTNDFSDALKNFQVIQRTAVQKQKESVHRARANSGLKIGPFDDVTSQQSNQNLIDLASPGGGGGGGGGAIGSQQSVIQMEEEVDLETMREREQAIRKLESDILGVNQIFKDLATLVHDQGEVIDSIEANVENATSHIEEGVQQIAKAREYQTKARRKKFLIILILAIVLVIFITIIWTSLK